MPYPPCRQYLACVSVGLPDGSVHALHHRACRKRIPNSDKRRRAMKAITQEKYKLGFIGIGFMGHPIARRLLESGFQLMAYDRDRRKAAELIQYGGSVAQSVAEVSSTCNVVLTCLPSDQVVLDIYRGSDGVFANVRPGSLVIDMSTVYPDTSQILSNLGSQHSVEVLDVTISGSTPVAEKGLLTLFGGGNKECFDGAESIFRAIAHQYFYLGPTGSGAKMKLVVNTLLGIGMQAIAEAVALGEKSGLDRERLLEVLAKTAVIAPAHVGKLARVAVNDYSPQFPLRLMNKDFDLILKAAAREHVPMPATEAAFYVNSEELTGNNNEKDFSAVLRRMEEVAGIELTPSNTVTG